MNRKKMWVAYCVWTGSIALFLWMGGNPLVSMIASIPVMEHTVRWARR